MLKFKDAVTVQTVVLLCHLLNFFCNEENACSARRFFLEKGAQK